jgi:YfiH family protein
MSLYQTKFFFTSKADSNLAFHVDDNITKVIANHKALAQKYKYNLDKLVHMKQIHSNIVHVVDENDNFENPPTCDALITNKKEIPLMVMVADCTPILFFDDVRGVVAVAHAGRQGAFKNIVKNVLDAFVRTYNSNVKNIKVKIGFSICQECYEVGKEINEEARELQMQYAIKKKNNSYYLDVNKILINQLKDYGVLDSNIELSNECSSCNNDYYSYRRDGQTGRFAAVIVLN